MQDQDTYRVTADAWNQVADQYASFFMDVSFYAATFRAFCDGVPEGARILEIACGPGNVTAYLADNRPDFRIEAIDIAPNMLMLARKNNPGVHFWEMDCRDLGTLPGPYDAMLCGFGMPYLSREDVIRLLGDVASLLVAGGLFYFSVIEGDYSASGYESGSNKDLKMYVYYYREEELVLYIRQSGLKCINIFRMAYTHHNGSVSTHLVFIVQKA